MLADTKAAIRKLLYQHYEFAECIIANVVWKNQGATVDVLLNYIWSDTNGWGFDQRFYVKEGLIRANLELEIIKTIRFHLVQELHVQNWLPSDLESLESLGWGFSEVSAIRIHEDNLFLSKYRNLPREYHHITFRWEGDRRIDVVFAAMEILEEHE
jgi:hypothetical protein